MRPLKAAGKLNREGIEIDAVIKIRRMQQSEWSTYRRLRINALMDAPDAFGAAYDQVRSQPDEWWQERLALASNDYHLPLFGCVDDAPVGLAWGRVFEAEPAVVNLFQMWVESSCRSCGVGRALLMAVIDWARQRDACCVRLSVTIADSPAWQMYASAGFLKEGDPEPLREDSPLMVQPMILNLRGM